VIAPRLKPTVLNKLCNVLRVQNNAKQQESQLARTADMFRNPFGLEAVGWWQNQQHMNLDSDKEHLPT
jgi:hypothetical protein